MVIGWHRRGADRSPGLPADATEYKELIVRTSKWPAPDEVLPVLINPKDHNDLDVVWDEVKTGAEAMRTSSETTGWSWPASTGLDVSVDAAIVDTLRQMFPDAQVSVGSEVQVGFSSAGGWPQEVGVVRGVSAGSPWRCAASL